MKQILTLFVAVLALAASAARSSAESLRTDINPALLYFQAFILAPDLAPGDREWLLNTEWRGKKLPERFGELVSRYDNQFKFVRQAARCTVPCDWGIDMTPGPATLLPHLARMKAIAQTARLRAMWDFQKGRTADAKDDLLAVLVAARNASRDGTLISVLVEIAAEQIVYTAVAENFYQFPEEALKELADGITTGPVPGTMANSIKSEKAFFHDWMVGQIRNLQKENPGDDRKVMAGIEEMFTVLDGPVEGSQTPGNHWGQLAKASGGTSQGVLNLLREQESLYEKAAKILGLPKTEYEAQIQQFQTEVQTAENPFISLTFPAIAKARTKELAAQIAQAMVQAAVQYRLHGDSGLKTISDPWSQGPFLFERFLLDGVDRGFALRSVYTGRGFQESMIFVEKDGPAFQVAGTKAGQPSSSAPASK